MEFSMVRMLARASPTILLSFFSHPTIRASFFCSSFKASANWYLAYFWVMQERYLIFDVQILHSLKQEVDIGDDVKELGLEGKGLVSEARDDLADARLWRSYAEMSTSMSSDKFLIKMASNSVLLRSLD
jgi:hypothetical protein